MFTRDIKGLSHSQTMWGNKNTEPHSVSYLSAPVTGFSKSGDRAPRSPRHGGGDAQTGIQISICVSLTAALQQGDMDFLVLIPSIPPVFRLTSRLWGGQHPLSLW